MNKFDSILIFGTFRKVSGTYFDSLTATSGCDSIISTTLIAFPLATVSFTGLDSTYCVDDIEILDTLVGTPTGGTFSGPGMLGTVFGPSAAGLGVSTILYTVIDTNGCVGSHSQDVDVSNCLAIESQALLYHLEIYPNPNTGIFTMEISNTLAEICEIKVFNIAGLEVYSVRLENFKGIYKREIDLREQPAGIYTLQLSTEKGVLNKQVVVE